MSLTPERVYQVSRDFEFMRDDVKITICIASQKIRGKICADALSIASPVWKSLLFPPQPVIKKEDERNDSVPQVTTKYGAAETARCPPVNRLDFTAEDPDALLVLLRITHLQFSSIPTHLPSKSAFLNIAIIVQKYDCPNLIQPWLPTWLQSFKEGWKHDDLGTCREARLYAYWVLGKLESFSELVQKLVRSCGVDAEGKHLGRGGEKIPEHIPMPPGIIESILTRRSETIRELLQIPYQLVETFTQKCTSERLFCQDPQCDALAYGSLLFGLQAKGLWPRVDVGDVTESIDNLAWKVQNMKIWVLSINDGGDHEECEERFDREEAVRVVLSAVGDPVLEMHRKHMIETRERL